MMFGVTVTACIRHFSSLLDQTLGKWNLRQGRFIRAHSLRDKGAWWPWWHGEEAACSHLGRSRKGDLVTRGFSPFYFCLALNCCLEKDTMNIQLGAFLLTSLEPTTQTRPEASVCLCLCVWVYEYMCFQFSRKAIRYFHKRALKHLKGKIEELSTIALRRKCFKSFEITLTFFILCPWSTATWKHWNSSRLS